MAQYVIGAALIVGGVITENPQLIMMGMAMLASAVVAQAFANDTQPNPDGASMSMNPGNRQQIAPATDNKLPVVYGTAYVGGIVTDLTISENNQESYYVISITEVTGNGTDTITFGDIYFGGKKVIFNSNGYTVDALLDESTGTSDTSVAGKIEFYLYSNGSNSPVNSSKTAIEVMQTPGLIYTWDSAKLMTNCAFAILHLSYSQSAGVRGLQDTKFQVSNSRKDTGDCFYDYLTNEVYGAAISVAQINTDSLDELTIYSNELVNYTNNSGGTSQIKRFQFDGVLETNVSIMDNLQYMANCCDCLLKYNEITAQWGVIVQKSVNVPVMDINDSNMASTISVTPIDIAGSYNVAECKFPDSSNQDTFNTAIFDLKQIAPSLLYPNEPINKVSISLPLVNNNVRAQLIANRLLKSAREDLQVQVDINFIGIQLEAGDIVTVTNANYGWVAKEFRIIKVVENFLEDGAIYSKLSLSEFNGSVYNDASITEFLPSPNTGIGSPTTFGTLIAPVVVNQYPNAANPYFTIQVQTSQAGITQYAEIWYSAYSNPLQEQMYFAGTSEIQSNGTPWNPSTILPIISLPNIPTGNWYFFSRMVNSLASSTYSPASTLLFWRPTTFQYSERYLSVAYADSITGTGFTLDPTNKTYYGLYNQSGTTPPTDPSVYSWYLANPDFDTSKYLLFTNRTGRKFSFATGFAAYASGTATFVPTSTLDFDQSIWSGLPNGVNSIDLDARTGQLTQTGTTSVGTGELAIVNNPNGTITAALQRYLDFGGPYTKTSAVATLTVDIYGRVVGFESPDDFDYTLEQFVATSGQTVFNVTRDSTYISGQCFVFRNGLLFDTTEYTDTGGSTGTVTLSTGAITGDSIAIISFRSVNSTSGVYASFTRNTVTLTNQASYTASGFTLISGLELMFLNGTVVNAQDYDISGQDINFIDNATGVLQIIQWSLNNLGVANGTPVNIDAYTIVGQTIYPFSYNINAVNIYNNGVKLIQGTDFTTATGTYTLAITPDTINNILVQQTFDRTGAA